MPYKDPTKRSEWQKQWRLKNPERYKYHVAKRNNKMAKLRKQAYHEFKSRYSCVRCGENHPACIQFHHRNPAEKEYEISRFSTVGSFEAMEKEVAKCDVLCANCHAKLHWDERNSKPTSLETTPALDEVRKFEARKRKKRSPPGSCSHGKFIKKALTPKIAPEENIIKVH